MRTRTTPLRTATAGALALAVAALLPACSDGEDTAGGEATEMTTTTTGTSASTVDRPAGPGADLSEELTAGKGVFLGAASTGPTLDEANYLEAEYVAAGTATSYRSVGELPTDGRFELEAAESAAYRTRVVVRRPVDEGGFNGTVVVEWLNVSGGIDANPDYAFMATELVRGGYAWVGVSAQRIGVEGGAVAVSAGIGEGLAGQGLKALDPERYGSLEHPGDAFSYDIVTQVARTLRQGGGALGDLMPERVLAVGESQSAFALTTYANGVQPLTRAFDGFLIHSRGGAAAPLGEPGGAIDIAGTIGGAPTIVRTDLEEPVLILQTETDVVSLLNYFPARQDDTDSIRLWEVAGTAHADRFLLGPLADSLDCGGPINDGPQQYVVRAGLRALDSWVRTGEAPTRAERLEVEEVDGRPAIRRDADGIALGGIRLPQVEVPVDALSGDPGPNPSVICLLMGSTTPLPEERLVELHGDRAAYLEAYESAVQAAVQAGYVLEDDVEAVMADVRPERVPA